MPAYTPEAFDSLARSFERDGYLVLRNVVPREPLAKLADELADAHARAQRSGELFEGGGGLTGHLNCFPGRGSRFIYDTLKEEGIVDFIRRVHPKGVGEPYVGCNFNLPGSVAQHYHIDGTFAADFIVCNVSLVDTDLSNGATDVLPGTHLRHYPFWEFAMRRKSRLSTRVITQRGDVVLRTSRLWHRGMPNLTSTPRPMFALTFVTRTEGFDQDPFEVEGGKITFHPNWFRPNLLGRLRERTYITAPITYDAYRFVRSLVGNKGYDS